MPPSDATITINGLAASAAPTANREFTIDELAQAADMTVRNVRAYQDKGLIPPPEIRGRTGIYSSAHLARLRVIGPLLAKGYTLSNIAEMIEAWERGHDLSQLLGLEQAITSPWTEEVPTFYELSELMTLFGRQFSPELLARAIQAGLISVDGARFKAPSPRLFNAGVELVGIGIPLISLLDLLTGMRANVDQVAGALVKLVVKHVFDVYGSSELPPAADVPRLADVVWRLRPLADLAVSAELSRAMEKAMQAHLGERMDSLFQLLNQGGARKR